jgi:hypothetical protein
MTDNDAKTPTFASVMILLATYLPLCRGKNPVNAKLRAQIRRSFALVRHGAVAFGVPASRVAESTVANVEQRATWGL